ncbi:hypothetical protein S40285_02330 [Stachybotrys chlorohalonatus IBT 40285]|uniref:Aquaporin-like protein n=1 Tax=Stachybotrys chlorohalonatus (strain IBT 40285) TaxID=1283841 RepID=A0A084QSF7_STAC4|nr:hypothetical protein S40285_02330 [Stachybotrys chlorohalonata IBT 40285]
MPQSINDGDLGDGRLDHHHDLATPNLTTSVGQGPDGYIGRIEEEETQHNDTVPTFSRPGLYPGGVSKRTNRTGRSASHRTRATTQPYTDVPRRPHITHYPQQATQTSHLGWADEEYLEENPWYYQDNRKPIFSLGRPLPHVVRRRRRIRRPRKTEATKDEEMGDMEEIVDEEVLGNEAEEDWMGGPCSRIFSNRPQRIPTRGSTVTRDTQQQQSRATAAGVAHGSKRNDAGQPVFDYMPGEPDAGDAQLHGSASHTTDMDPHRPPRSGASQAHAAPDFKIDGEPLGQQERPEVEDGRVNPDELRNWWARFRARHPEPLAEFLATGVAVFLGLTATLSVNLSANQASAYGDYETSCWAWGFAWMFGIYLGGGVSGAHMNPAISVSLSIFRGFPWRQCAVYVAVQFLASLAAGALAYGLFADSIRHVDPDMSEMARSFFSTPQEWMSLRSAFASQLVGSAVMSMTVLALGDDQNNPPGAGMHALIIGLLVTTLRFTLGYNIGAALNPASDFGPRVVAYAVGYRERDAFQTRWWLYGPWVATMLGSVTGCIVYDGCVFNGSESPVNYRMGEVLKEKEGRFRAAFARWRGKQ